MTGSQAVWFAIALTVGILGLQAVLWTVILRRRRRRIAEMTEALRDELGAAGERVLLGPSGGRFTGSPDRPHTSAGGVAVLTDRRWVFRTFGGGNLDVPFERITGLRDDKWFRGKMQGGRRHIIFATAPGEIGFIVAGDLATWMTALRQALGPRAGADQAGSAPR